MRDHLIQGGILLSAMTAAWLLTSKSPRARCWGCIAGFAGQPLWIGTALEKEQWGIFLLSFWYAGCYIKGFFGNRA